MSWRFWICPEHPRGDLTVVGRRSRDGYGGGGSVNTTLQVSAGGGGVGDGSDAMGWAVRAVDSA